MLAMKQETLCLCLFYQIFLSNIYLTSESSNIDRNCLQYICKCINEINLRNDVWGV